MSERTGRVRQVLRRETAAGRSNWIQITLGSIARYVSKVNSYLYGYSNGLWKMLRMAKKKTKPRAKIATTSTNDATEAAYTAVSGLGGAGGAGGEME